MIVVIGSNGNGSGSNELFDVLSFWDKKSTVPEILLNNC